MSDYLYKVGFIGAGNMARALIKGILKSKLYNVNQIIVSDKEKSAIEHISKQIGLTATYMNKEIVKKAGVILLCVKPQNIKDVLMEIKDELTQQHLIISIAAGISIKTILRTIGKNIPIIRVMPNTPALVQKAISGIACGYGVKDEHKNIALNIFNSVGETIIVKESMLDLITAISGSGPGYIFKIMEYMLEIAIKFGLDEDSARKLIVQTFVGASHLAMESEESLPRLREMVTSPGGTTEAALFVFEKAALKDIIHDAIKAAYNRSVEIKKEWEK